MNKNIIQIKDLVRDFPGVRALDHVSFDVERNTIHCIVGENGAGKSTLIKILTGALSKTSGTIFLDGEAYQASNTKEAREFGISTLFQELNLVDQLTVEENLTLGIEDTKFGFLLKTDKIKKMVETLKSIDPNINENNLVSKLSVAEKQLVEIARAVASASKIIIMDEPTAAISESEIKRLFSILKNLKEKHVTIIYISHRLDEIFELGDKVTVIRDGKHVDTKPVNEVEDRAELITMMLGKSVAETYSSKPETDNDTLMEVRHVSNPKLKNISFGVNRGEIIGFYGLVGSGKTELARIIYGMDTYDGDIVYKGKKFEANSPYESIQHGITLIPEERRTQGLFTVLTIRENISVTNLDKISKASLIQNNLEKNYSNDYIDKLNIATSNAEKEVALLSGGNQQKVVIAKSLFADADLLLLDEPTRGVDVGAKEEIHSIIQELAIAGKSIIVFSSELAEITNLCDRIFLLYEGELKAEIRNGPNIDKERIMHIVQGERNHANK